VDPPPVVAVYETVVYGPDIEALASFYADVLGLRPVGDIDDVGAAFRLADDGMLLVFDPVKAAQSGRAVPSHGASGPGHVAFAIEAGSHDDWLAYLKQRDVEIERVLTWRRGASSIYVRDPAGNSVELVDGEAWPP
jgi:catechol 2,3-dioxygenase-like lactoylglutathione lyase family enzyme